MTDPAEKTTPDEDCIFPGVTAEQLAALEIQPIAMIAEAARLRETDEWQRQARLEATRGIVAAQDAVPPYLRRRMEFIARMLEIAKWKPRD